jgi:hypothetical protein
MHMGVLPHDVNYCVRRTHVTRDLSCLKADRESWFMYECCCACPCTCNIMPHICMTEHLCVCNMLLNADDMESDAHVQESMHNSMIDLRQSRKISVDLRWLISNKVHVSNVWSLRESALSGPRASLHATAAEAAALLRCSAAQHFE